MPAKNTLRLTDAQLVETAFQDRLVDIGEDGSLEERSDPVQTPSQAIPNETIFSIPPENEQQTGTQADADTVTVPRRRVTIAAKTVRLRDKDHRKFVAMQPCLVCGRAPVDPHHLRFAQPRAMSRKVSDEFTVPVCRMHHRELHTHGDERLWWKRLNIDPLPIALKLWKRSRADDINIPSDVGHPQQQLADDTIARRDAPQFMTMTLRNGRTRP